MRPEELRQGWSFRKMRLVRALCAIAAVVLVTKSVAAEPSLVLAATDAASPIESAAPTSPKSESEIATAPIETDPSEPAGHRASDVALAPAAVEEMPEEMVKAAPLERPEPTLFADIDLASQRMTVRDADGKTYGPWKISSARGGYTTPTGTYSANWTSRMHYSKQYHWSPMPYSVFFNRGVATHGTTATGSLGRPASHGCVRLHTGNAKTFYNLVEKHGKKLTQIKVHGTPPYTPAVAERRQPRYAQPTFSPFSFFSGPPAYQPRKRRYRRQQYGGSYGAR
jgi:lipoprotein-anchoring transpeptidase ErfK/SrfK